MKKIHRVISSCNECENCKFLPYPKDNYTFYNVCDKEENEPFLLLKHNSKSNSQNIEIPKNCPLEDYEKKD
jgi:hypothetical protein